MPESVIAFDTETELISQGNVFPRVACASFYDGTNYNLQHQSTLGPVADYMLDEALAGRIRIVCHNLAFDMGVLCRNYPHLLPKVFACYEQERIECTEIRARMLDIAEGRYEGFARFLIDLQQNPGGKRRKIDYRLNTCTQRFLGYEIEGKGEVQLTYGELIDVPLTWWSEEARTYPLADVRATRDLWSLQEPMAGEWLIDRWRQYRAAFWMALMTGWGIRTSPERVQAYAQLKTDRYNELVQEMLDLSLMRWGGTKAKPKLVRDTKVAKQMMSDHWPPELGELPTSDKGNVSLAGENLVRTGYDPLIHYAEIGKLGKAISTDIPALLKGTTGPIHSRFITIRDTGRTSSRKPNIQNVKRDPGVRECFVPSQPGWVFIQADWSSFELCTWAEVCYTILGHSRLRDALNAKQDPHLEMAGLILGRDPATLDKSEHDVDQARQTGKVANFGFPGGLGIQSMIDYAWSGYEVKLSQQESAQLKKHWQTAWPESKEYFSWINSMVGRGSSGGLIQQLYSQRFRGGCTFTQAANSFFQGLAADAAKAAGWCIAKSSYLDPQSPLFGFRLVNFVHDEFILEGPEERAPEAAEELSTIMIKEASKWTPNVLVRAEPCVMNCWSKKAKTLRDQNGRLMTWRYTT